MQIKNSTTHSQQQQLASGTAKFAVEAMAYTRAALHGGKKPPPTQQEFALIRRACEKARPVSRREAATFTASLMTALAALTQNELQVEASIWPLKEGEWSGGVYVTQLHTEGFDDKKLSSSMIVALAGAAITPNPRINVNCVLQAIEIAQVLSPNEPVSLLERNCATAFQICEQFADQIRAISDLLFSQEEIRTVKKKTMGIIAGIRGAGVRDGQLSQRGKAWVQAKTAFAKEIL